MICLRPVDALGEYRFILEAAGYASWFGGGFYPRRISELLRDSDSLFKLRFKSKTYVWNRSFMQIIDAIWEQRNLGVSCYEIRIEPNDDIKTVMQQLAGLKEKQYMVVKISSSCPWATLYFQELGYKFTESAITLNHTLKQISVPPRIKKVFDKCKWLPMTDEDILKMKSEIGKNIFKTDRIYLDPKFKKEQSAQRYTFWLEDLIYSGVQPHKVCYNNEVIGFFINKEIKEGVYDGILAAVYSDFEGTGLGVCVQYMGLDYAISRGGKKYIGHVSANNISVLKSLLSIGFEITEIEYILVKHN